MVYGNIVVYFKTNQPGLMQGALIPRVIVTIGAIGIMIGLTVIAITLLELIQQKGQQKKS